MKKILFFIHDLGQGGAEKVLVSLVNHMDRSKFDITVMAQFGGGVNEQLLSPHIKLVRCHKRAFKGNSRFMKLFSPKALCRHYIKEHYDIIVSYLEGPSARIVGGCTALDTKLVSWIHCQQHNAKIAAQSYRSFKEAEESLNRFDRIVCVSQPVKEDLLRIFNLKNPVGVLYNTVETEKIIERSKEPVEESFSSEKVFKLIGVGTLKHVKGFDRMIRIHKRLTDDGFPVHTYILGKGPESDSLKKLAEELGVSESVSLLGYNTNPYKYVSKCDLFVCSSHAEGFSTAATEALITGTPVCTVDVSGMREMLGENNEYGVVTENSEEALYQGIKRLLDDPALLSHYKEKAIERGKLFSTEATVRATEAMLLDL